MQEESGREGISKSGARKIALEAILLIPRFIQLLFRLFRDKEVRKRDKTICLACIGYVLMPFDFLPDFIPFLGQVDDVFIVALGIRHLLKSAGREKVEQHWSGSKDVIRLMQLIPEALLFFLSPGKKARLEKWFGKFEKREQRERSGGADDSGTIDVKPDDYEVKESEGEE